MKKTLLIIISAAIIFVSTAAAAQNSLSVPGYEGGICNETVYKEYVFVTGKPVLMTGSYTVRPGRMKDNVMSTSYSYKLENQEEDAKLTRRITVETVFSNDERKSQEIATSTITGFSETVSVGKVSYRLEDYQFSQSIINDMEPAATYSSGNWEGRKTYSINRNQGELTVQTVGDIVGYDNNWGATHTQKIDYILDLNRRLEISKGVFEDISWSGSARLQLVFNRTKELIYIPNEPSWISFRGGYLETENSESILSYEALLPKFSADGIPNNRLSRSGATEKLDNLPKQRRLPVPAFKDVEGHWAKEDIYRLTGLGVLEPQGDYFGPSLPVTRRDFARAIAVALNMIEPEGEKTSGITTRVVEPPPEPQLFNDVPPDAPDYKYIQEVAKRGVINGLEPKTFGPDEPLSRAQAVTILVRSLGFSGLAPVMPFNTGFSDDYNIPVWAKPSVYVARDIGLLSGDAFGRANPDDNMTRAETAAFINRFIEYLQNDIKQDYYRAVFERP
jgi:hypothetical protein